MSKPKIEDQIKRLPESNETWAVVNRPAPIWVDDVDGGPMRPTVLAILEVSSSAARYFTVSNRKSATSAELLGFLYDAMLLTPHPETQDIETPDRDFEPCRPARVVVEGVALASALAPKLRQVGVACEGMERIDGLDAFVRDMDSHFNPDDVGGLARIPGMSVFNQQEFYAAAAAYHTREPWKWMVNIHVIEFHYSADPKPALVTIMGNARQEFGLTIFADIHQVEKMLAASESGPTTRFFRTQDVTSVTFTSPYEGHSFEDLDDAARFNLPIANPDAYPLLLKIVPPAARVAPAFEDVMRYAALMRVLPDFVDTHLDAIGRLPRPAQATFDLPEIYAGHTISLRFPAYGRAPIRTPEWEARGLVDEDSFSAWLFTELNGRTPFKCNLLPEAVDDLRSAGFRIRGGQKVICHSVIDPSEEFFGNAEERQAHQVERTFFAGGEEYPGLLAAVAIGSKQALIPLIDIDHQQPDLPCGAEIGAYRLLYECADAEMMDDEDIGDGVHDFDDPDTLQPDDMSPEFLKMAFDSLMTSMLGSAPPTSSHSMAKGTIAAKKKPKPKK
ncbi:MAG: hypothetical protein ABIQ99_17350 [Thermoflexales bacterium]